MFTIESGVPIPQMSKRGAKISVFTETLLALEVGQSFFASSEEAKSAATRLHNAGKKHNRRFIARKVDGGHRVWRVE